MAQYRKKPVVVEAFQYGYEGWPDWFAVPAQMGEIVTRGTHCLIATLEGEMKGNTGDYIIRGVHGEIYPCKPDIFEATYEPVEEPEPA